MHGSKQNQYLNSELNQPLHCIYLLEDLVTTTNYLRNRQFISSRQPPGFCTCYHVSWQEQEVSGLRPCPSGGTDATMEHAAQHSLGLSQLALSVPLTAAVVMTCRGQCPQPKASPYC